MHHFSFYSSPYNHLVGEATALFLIALAIPAHPDARKWRRKARAVLVEYGPQQFYADGFCVEQATGYHFYTLGFLTMALIAARDAGEPLQELEPVVQRAFRAGAALRQPDGRWPAIGDVDSARSIPVHPADFWSFDSLCHVAAVLFCDSELKVGDTPGEELYWLLGCDGLAAWKALPPASTRCAVHLRESGYVVAGNGRDWMLFDAGPISHGLFADSTPSTAHGHLDTLQVLYCAAGEAALVDSGMPWYFRDRRWVRHFRSSAAHNTVEIAGLSTAREAGALAWSNVCSTPTLDADLRDDAWLARARLFLDRGASIERHVFCLPGAGLWIADWIELDRERQISWYWNLAPQAELEEDDEGFVIATASGRNLFSIHATSEIRQRVIAPSTASPEAWNAPGYGIIEPAKALRANATATEALVLTGLARQPVHVTVSRGDRAVGPERTAAVETYWSGSIRWSVCRTEPVIAVPASHNSIGELA